MGKWTALMMVGVGSVIVINVRPVNDLGISLLGLFGWICLLTGLVWLATKIFIAL